MTIGDGADPDAADPAPGRRSPRRPPSTRPRARCRSCGRPEAARAVSYVCRGLLRPARGRLRPRRRSRDAVTRAIIARPARRASGATASCCPSSAPPARGLAVGGTPLIAAGAAGRGPRHRRPAGSRTTPATRPSRSRTARWPSRPRGRVEFGLDTLACASTGNLAGRDGGGRGGGRPARLRVRARGPGAGQDRPRPGLRRDGRPDRRHVRRGQPPVAWRSPTSSAGASSTSTSGRSTRRAARRSPSRSRSARLAAARTSSSAPIASGAHVHKRRQGLRGARRGRPGRAAAGAGSSAARPPAARRWPRRSPSGARRDRPVETPDDDRPLAGDRQPGRRRVCARARPPRPAARSRRSTTRRPRTRSVPSPRSRASSRRRPAASRSRPPRRHGAAASSARRRGRRAPHRQRAQDAGRALVRPGDGPATPRADPGSRPSSRPSLGGFEAVARPHEPRSASRPSLRAATGGLEAGRRRRARQSARW